MSYLGNKIADELLQQARQASMNTYSPYSGFGVGAAVLTGNGSVFTGANIENASFGLTICAERIALGNAIANGQRDITAIAIYAPVRTISPCGACRQFILEFGRGVIVIFMDGDTLVQKTAKELLPFAFTKATLQQE